MTDLERLKTSPSGNVLKDDAIEWLLNRSEPTPEDVLEAITPKRYDAEGSTYASPASEVRISGTPEFVETVAGLLKPFIATETDKTRLNINLQPIKDRDTGKITENYALHLHAVERGSGRQPRTNDAIPDDLSAIIQTER